MKSVKRGAVKRVLAATAASAVGVLSAFVVAASPAEAYCYSGHGSPQGVTLTNTHNGRYVAMERAASGTCDGDGIYNGQLKDPVTDGYSARVVYRDGSFEEIVAYASGDWKDYRFYDQNGSDPGFAMMQIYASPASRTTWWTANESY